MINESVRLIAGWLANHLADTLAALPISAGDARPTGVVVRDQTSDVDVAVGQPVRGVTHGVSVAFAGMDDLMPMATQLHRDGQATLLVRYEGNVENPATAAIAMGYVMRAVLITLNNYFRDASSAEQTQNGVQLAGPLKAQLVTLPARNQTEPISAGVVLVLQVRDGT